MKINKQKVAPYQQGGSIFSTIMVLILVGLVAMSGLKVAPAYIDNGVIVSAIEALDENTGLSEMRVRDIRNGLSKTLLANGMRDFDYQNVQVVTERGEEYIDVNYEVRVPLFYNIEAVVIFENRFDK